MIAVCAAALCALSMSLTTAVQEARHEVRAAALAPTFEQPPDAPPALRALIEEHWPAAQVENALAVAWFESGHCHWEESIAPNADGSTDLGCFQINARYHTCEGLREGERRGHGLACLDGARLRTDRAYNVAAAAELHAKQGWCPWVAARKVRGLREGCP